MNSIEIQRTKDHNAGAWSLLAAAVALLLSLSLAGCGMQGAPLPPSLKLPTTVTDLAAVRTGDQVTLTWTMPKRNTDKLVIKGNTTIQVCRKAESDNCVPVPTALQLLPSAKGTFTESLPALLTSGAPRKLAYFVELKNARGKSAGLSNAATVLAGEAPPPVSALAATLRKDGVVLKWAPAPASAQPDATVLIRLRRTLLTPQPKTETSKTGGGLLPTEREPVEVNLLVERESNQRADRTLDASIRFGETYEYRAQRVARILSGDQTLELDGPLSEPVRVQAIDVFPPDVPVGLAAVATASDQQGGPSIDLSWQPVTNSDLAGYAVYRSAGTSSDANWQRISPVQPLVGPGFHDPDVKPGQTYRYAVTAIDRAGHESARSTEAQEAVPNP